MVLTNGVFRLTNALSKRRMLSLKFNLLTSTHTFQAVGAFDGHIRWALANQVSRRLLQLQPEVGQVLVGFF